MKKLLVLGLMAILSITLLSGCGSKDESSKTLDPKHQPFPDYVLNAGDKVQEAYVLASEYPEALAVAPCFCGCYNIDGHKSNLDCFVDGMGPDREVTGWDTMGIS
jgi:hypothetical protein